MYLLRLVASGAHPLAGLSGRVVGATVRSLEQLRRRGYLQHKGRHDADRASYWHITPLGERAMRHNVPRG